LNKKVENAATLDTQLVFTAVLKKGTRGQQASQYSLKK